MRYVRKILKGLVVVLAALLVLGMVVVLLLSQGVLNERLARVISSQGTRILNADFKVQSIQGNPLSCFSVNGLRVFRGDTAYLSLDSLKADYRIGSLIRQKVHINKLQMKGLHLYGVQERDSSWSFEKIFPGDDSERDEPDTSQTSVPWKICLEQLSVDDVSANLSPLDSVMIPSSIDLEGRFSFTLSQDTTGRDSIEANLNQLFIQTRSPDLTLSRMQGQFRKVQNRISWQQVSIDFIKTHMRSSGTAILPGEENNDRVGATAHLEIDPLCLQEFHPWMSQGKLYGSPGIKVDLIRNGHHQRLKVELKEKDQSVVMGGSIAHIMTQPQYNMTLTMEHLDGLNWTRDSTFSSDLTGAVRLEGQGTKPDSLQAHLEVDLKDSHLMDQPLKDMHTVLDYNRQAYHLRGLKLNSPYFSLDLQGEGHIRGMNRLQFDLAAGDVQSFARRMGLPEINFDGRINGKAEGTLDSMDVFAAYELNHLYYDTLFVKQVKGDASALLSRDSLLRGALLVSVDSSYVGDQWIEKISLHSLLDQGHLQNNLEVRVHDSLSLKTFTGLSMEKDPRIFIKMFQLRVDTAKWQGGSDSTHIVLGKDSVVIEDWILRSGKQQIGVDGTYRFRGKEDLHVWIERLDLGQWSPLLGFPHSVRGTLSSDISLAGTASHPRLQGNVEIEHPGWDTLQLRRIHTGLRYDSSVLSMEGHVDADIHRMIRTRASLPLEFSLTDSLLMPDAKTPVQASLMVDSLDASLVNPLLADQGMELQGLMDASIEVTHTLGDPEFSGRLNFAGGSFSYPPEGIDYKNIAIRSRFSRRQLQIEQVLLESGEGHLNIQGYVDLPFLDPQAPDSLNIRIRGKDFTAIQSARAEAVLEPSVDLRGSFSKPVLKGDLNIPRASVNVDAFRQEMGVKSDEPNPPLLIAAMKDTLPASSSPKDSLSSSPTSEPLLFLSSWQDSTSEPRGPITGKDIYNNLQGHFDIHIPGNTWVKGENLNFEVQGHLKAIKESQQIDLFGTLNVRRGFFQFYGKKFDFEQGEIVFTGGREINPLLDMIIVYGFRDAQRERQRLSIEVTGRALDPRLQFRLNEQTIQEKEALSYLMFGKAPEQLTTAEQTSFQERTGQMATSFALNRVSSAVTKALGAGLGLDMVELEAGKNWKSGNVKIGKYVTNNLYLSYQRTFAFDKREKVVDADRISLEYQIMRSLFLQATNQMNHSGFDLIFKTRWK